MDTALDEAKEALLRDIIAEGSDAVSLFLNDTDGLEGEGEAGSGDRTMEVEGHDYDGFGDGMPVEEGNRDGSSADRTESGQVNILVKPVLTS